LNKLVNVIKVIDYHKSKSIERELVLIKVTAEAADRAEILRIVDIFRGKIVDMTPKSYTIEIAGSEEKVSAILEMLKPMGIKELARTGKIVLGRGVKTLK